MKKQEKQLKSLKIERNKDYLIIEGYKIKKNLGWLPIIIITPILLIILAVQGTDAFGKSINAECPMLNPEPTCTYSIGKENYTLQRGETKTLNDQNTPLVKIANYGTWTILLLTAIYNHKKYNT